MADTERSEDAQLFPRNVGERLREAREAQGMQLTQVADATRIPLRHLESIESAQYSNLPSPTYAMGFARAYARVVGADEVAIANDLRGELDANYHREPPSMPYDTSDPVRVPTGGIAFAGLAVAILVLIGVGIWYGTSWFRSDDAPPEPIVAATPAATPSAAPKQSVAVPQSGGQVTLTADDEVWVRIYDANDRTLLMKTMQPGESYDVPQDADRPMINVGRPDQIKVTINGAQVAPLGTGERAIKDVGVSAEALRARAGQQNAATPAE
ncbi:DUF4115 domain-containing protein [Stakelama sp. CBK3Z-3]|uniref:DUF4115 domain-containing protein n=1 Tax=Stakelama flava TaxID=2860338 RepID=A0ABS6XQ82_9SPHN|nr:helix-turn-helix domain-containing protein [Stakelama flava]MBW4332044.1 DUF4115 domain-containing protein [Stakelama flava]